MSKKKNNLSQKTFSTKAAFAGYSLLWKIAKPFLSINNRLKEGWRERNVHFCPSGPFDIWIQAASVGEAYLALELIKTCPFTASILVTSCTKQGLDILRSQEKKLKFTCTYFPFDQKILLKKFIQNARPGLALLLETEIWPNMLQVCQKKNVPVCIVNARMSTRSFARYLLLRPLLTQVGPSRILAISERDKKRFQVLFPEAEISVMGNIKFDRFLTEKQIPYVKNPLAAFFRPTTPPIVFASVRQEEEEIIFDAIKTVRKSSPMTVIAVVPRHGHRLKAWQNRFKSSDYILRSQLQEQVQTGSLILWDVFGELKNLYALAKHVFVGGSLAPLGGQNFLEPLAQGVSPIIGPYWENFFWVGTEIFTTGLVKQVNSGQELAEAFLLPSGANPTEIIDRARDYAKKKGGGCNQVWQLVETKQQK